VGVEPLDPPLLIRGFDDPSRPAIVGSDPGDGVAGRDAAQDRHAGEDRARSAAPALAPHLDSSAVLGAPEGFPDLVCGGLVRRGQAEVFPVDERSRPGRTPAGVQIEAVVAIRVLLLALS